MIAAPGAAGAHRIERVLEAEAGQRQAAGRIFERRTVRIRARRPLEGDCARRVLGRRSGHCLDQRKRGGGKAVHGPMPLIAATRANKSYGTCEAGGG